MNTKQITSVVVIAVLVAGLSFYSGMKYGRSGGISQRGAQFGQFGGGNGAGRMAGAGRANRGGGFIAGEVLSKDATNITVKMRDGSSKIVFVSASTDVQKTVGGTADDLAIGKSISVMGSSNADGSITAQSVQIRTNVPVPPQGRAPIQPAQ